MHQLDKDIGDIAAIISDCEQGIIMELENAVLEFWSVLHQCAALLAELDCLIALGSCAWSFNYKRPKLSPDNVLYIKGGWHPVQALVVDPFVPNDTMIAPGKEGNVALITGPNFSGKSAYLKQVALIAYLAQIGSFVPAEVALIGLVDRLFSRISTLETVELGQSAFTIDLLQVATMLRHCTEHSLLLLDEFGKGTAPQDGMALLAATVEHITKLGPKCIVSTHFWEVVPSMAKLNGVVPYQMDVHISEEADYSDENGGRDRGRIRASTASSPPRITPMFKLTKGTAKSSYGLNCAVMAGVDQRVVARAQEVLTARRVGKSPRTLALGDTLRTPDGFDDDHDGGDGGGGGGGGGKGLGEDRDGGQARRQAVAEERNSRIVSQFVGIDDWETCDVSVVDRMLRLIRGTEGAAGVGAMSERFGMRAP
jgi:DNA mismatch repair protein MSH5